VEGEEGLSKNTLRRQHQDKADRIHVTSEKVYDGKVLRRFVIGAMKSVKVRRVLADGAYDSRENFNFLSHGVHLGWMVSWSRKRLDLGLEARCIALVLGELLRAFSLL